MSTAAIIRKGLQLAGFQTYRTQAKVVVKDYTQTGSVASGASESVVIHPPAGKAWKLLVATMKASADADWTSGYHHMLIRGETYPPGYFLYTSDYTAKVHVSQNTIRSANSVARPPNNNELELAMQEVIATPTEGLELRYGNGANAAQENDRIWQLRFLEIPLERVA